MEESKVSQGANAVLILAIMALVFAVGYWIRSKSISEEGAAYTAYEQTKNESAAASFPTKFDGRVIPATIYTTSGTDLTPQTIDAINRDIARFAIYSSMSAQLLKKDAAPVETYEELQEALKAQQSALAGDYFSKADFYAIYVPFAGHANAEKLKKVYPDPKKEARELMMRYQQLFVQEEQTPEQIMDLAKKDELLKLFSESGAVIQKNYSAETSLFPIDHSFNAFLFTLRPNQISNIYTLKQNNSQDAAYVIVYPTHIRKHLIDSVELLVDKEMHKFSYESP